MALLISLTEIKKKYNITSFHPTKFEDGIYAVSLHRKNTMKVDSNKELVQVKASNKQRAIKEALKDRRMQAFIERTEDLKTDSRLDSEGNFK